MEYHYQLIVALTSSATAIRLITYHRGDAKYRFTASFLAYVLIICTGGQALDICFNGAQTSGAWHAITSTIVMILALRARGNASRILDVGRRD